MVNAERNAIGISRRQQVATLSFPYRNNLQKKKCTRKVTGVILSGTGISASKFLIVIIVNKMKMLMQTIEVKILSHLASTVMPILEKLFFRCNMQNYWEKENIILAKIFTSLLHH